jgi:hypothetical protein
MNDTKGNLAVATNMLPHMENQTILEVGVACTISNFMLHLKVVLKISRRP